MHFAEVVVAFLVIRAICSCVWLSSWHPVLVQFLPDPVYFVEVKASFVVCPLDSVCLSVCHLALGAHHPLSSMAEHQHAQQVQQQQLPQQQRLLPDGSEGAEVPSAAKMEVDEKNAQSRRTSNSSSSSEKSQLPSTRSMHKALRAIRDDLDDVIDQQRSEQRQVLWLLHSQVRKDRAEASCQLAIQGFEPWLEDPDQVIAFPQSRRLVP